MLPKPSSHSKRVRWIEMTRVNRRKLMIATACSLQHKCNAAPNATLSRKVRDYARTGTLAVRSSLPQLTHAPLMARRIAFQMQ
jgi:hypothetical protein